MKAKKGFISILMLSIALLISACTPANEPDTPSNPPDDSNDKDVTRLEQEVKEKDAKIGELEGSIKELETKIRDLKEEEKEEEPAEQYGQEGHILVNSVNVLKALKEKDIDTLERYVHPEKGLRFSAYGNTDLENDIVIQRDELTAMFNDSKIFSWGEYDGRGDPIKLSLKDYWKEFVYDEDFLNPHIIAIDKTVSMGNTIDNVKEAYPQGQYIESYFEGFNEEYAGADWRSLKLVFEEYKGKWYLVGIIHNQWTV